jgi:hypothetical protein
MLVGNDQEKTCCDFIGTSAKTIHELHPTDAESGRLIDIIGYSCSERLARALDEFCRPQWRSGDEERESVSKYSRVGGLDPELESFIDALRTTPAGDNPKP